MVPVELGTVFSRIEAAASICFLYFLVRFVFEGGFYLRQFSVGNSSNGTAETFFHESGYNVIMG